jgi:hypothetical protein
MKLFYPCDIVKITSNTSFPVHPIPVGTVVLVYKSTEEGVTVVYRQKFYGLYNRDVTLASEVEVQLEKF